MTNSWKIYPLNLSTSLIKNIFGPNVAELRGKSVITKPTWVEREYTPIPRDFHVIHKFLSLKADVMFVNGLPFLITLSRKIKIFTAEYIPNRTAAQISSSINKIVKLYARNGFVVNVVMMDMEFEKFAENIGNKEVNTTTAREHAGEIEHGICVVKERERCIVSTLSSKSLHKQIVVHMIYYVAMWINSLPNKNGILQK